MKKLLTAILTAVIAIAAVAPLSASSSRRDLYRYNRLRDEACEKNLHALYSLLKQYASANKGLLPVANNYDGLKSVLPANITAAQLYCQASRGKKPQKNNDLNNKNISYIYFGGVNLNIALKNCPKLILLCDKPDSRHCYALLADGSVVDVKSLPGKPKISNCQDIVKALAEAYNYPADVLESMLVKAKEAESAL